MGTLGKAVTAILGVIAALACLATIAVLGYSFLGNKDEGTKKAASTPENAIEMTRDEALALAEAQMPYPTTSPVLDTSNSSSNISPKALPLDHIHDYKPTVIKKATCMEAGLIKYECVCGDYYMVDQLATGHVPDEWVIVQQPTDTMDGKKVRKCIYCDEVVQSEIIPRTGSSATVDENGNKIPAHEHLYVSTVEREPTCTLAGLRIHKCSCGSFYTETIPAIGHVAEDWINTVEPEVNLYGTAERRCSVCGTLLDSKVLLPLEPSPSPTASSGNASSSPASSGSPAASTSPSPSPSPHVHKYVSYVIAIPTCTERGIRSYICTCGSSYAETIELDLNNHSFEATFVAPTETQQGYTVYTCTRCNYSYKDNYLLPLSNKASADNSGDTNGD